MAGSTQPIDQRALDRFHGCFGAIFAAIPGIVVYFVAANTPNAPVWLTQAAGVWMLSSFASAIAARWWHRITGTFGWSNWTTYVTCGLAVGLFVAVISFSVLTLSVSLVAGVTGSLVFWFMRRPDTDPAPPQEGEDVDGDAPSGGANA